MQSRCPSYHNLENNQAFKSRNRITFKLDYLHFLMLLQTLSSTLKYPFSLHHIVNGETLLQHPIQFRFYQTLRSLPNPKPETKSKSTVHLTSLSTKFHIRQPPVQLQSTKCSTFSILSSHHHLRPTIETPSWPSIDHTPAYFSHLPTHPPPSPPSSPPHQSPSSLSRSYPLS